MSLHGLNVQSILASYTMATHSTSARYRGPYGRAMG